MKFPSFVLPMLSSLSILAKIACPYLNQYRCGYKGRCIYKSWTCNGVRNCWNGDDESDALCSTSLTKSISRVAICEELWSKVFCDLVLADPLWRLVISSDHCGGEAPYDWMRRLAIFLICPGLLYFVSVFFWMSVCWR